ncbi:UDP-glycosyltransferase UGT4-like [Culicoides brevitarsis]|uniref:UDP-glycosyltransferase UGT4-like n=1 Tax=Culicoides brevitarsis TaxID=469753 RepID=UPI00307B358E
MKLAWMEDLKMIFQVNLLLFLTFSVSFIDASRILCYFPNPSKSHVLLAIPICEELAARGHSVVAVTNEKFSSSEKNYKNIVIPSAGYGAEVEEMMKSGNDTSLNFLMKTSEAFRRINIETIKSAEFQRIMREEKFDLVFVINAFFNNVQLGIADHFKAPWVGLSPMGNFLPYRQYLGSHSFVATVPFAMAPFGGSMTLKERIINFLMNFVEHLANFYMDFVQKQEYESIFPPSQYRSYEEMKRNNSLLLLNTHFSDSQIIRPLLPNEVEIAGSQIKTKVKPLTGELKKFLDEATNGAILWTFGSNVDISSTQPEKVDIILKELAKLQERVVIKWEIDDKSRLPKNVFASKWLPQDSILAHPNTKLFIGHGGLGGVGEAKYYQVPILGMPFFGDQDGNMAKIVEEGWGRSIKLFDVTQENFAEILRDMLVNQKYRDNVKAHSDKFKDRIASALDTGVFWVEYVLKHHGAPHLRYPGKDLNFFQRHSLDVLAIIAGVLFVVWKFLKNIVNFCFSLKVKHTKEKRN